MVSIPWLNDFVVVKEVITLYKMLVIPLLEYCSVLWSPSSKGQIQSLESVQWSFLRKIRADNQDNYWVCLKKMKVYSLERRRERYRIIYIWKILENLVPNPNGQINSTTNTRLGRFCSVPKPLNTRKRQEFEACLPAQCQTVVAFGSSAARSRSW